VGVEGEAASRSGPLMMLDVLSSITQKIEVGEESVLDDIIPFKSGVRGLKGFSSGVVEIKCSADGGRSFLKGFGYVFAECVS
jgi:hypothetical protein